MFRKKLASVRVLLLAFGTALLIPVLAFAAVLLWSYAKSERTQFERQAQVAAHNVIASVDLELSKLQTAIEALATSPSVQAGNYQSFQRQALNALRLWSPEEPNRLAIVLRDLSSQQLVNTRVSWGQPLPRGANPNVDEEIITSRRPIVQGLFVGATATRPITSIRVPVFADGAVTHVLSIAIEPERFLDLLSGQKLSPDWILTLVDQNDRVIARSREHERFLGQLAPEEFRTTQGGNGGVWVGPNLESMMVLGAYERSLVSGWRAFVGLPESIAEGPLRRSLWLIAALGSWALALSYLLAVPFGRRIGRSAQTLASAAARLGQGHPVKPLASGLREMDEVSHALVSASTELRDREFALRESEARHRQIFNSAQDYAIIAKDMQGKVTAWNKGAEFVLGWSEEEMIGQSTERLFTPEDVAKGEPAKEMRTALEDGVAIDERWHQRKSGERFWSSGELTPLKDDSGETVGFVKVLRDRTEQRRADEHQRLLINELNHRVKNTLSTVQSIASQAFRGKQEEDGTRDLFEGRLFALAKAHDVLTRENWERAELGEIVAEAVAPYDRERARFEISGPKLWLKPRMALSLAMALHELATNAGKYGSLSVPEGRVSIRWTVTPGEASWLTLEWEERNGPPVLPPSRKGFGTRLLERSLAVELGGEVNVTYGASGVVCVVRAPLVEHTAKPGSPSAQEKALKRE
jgi:PAS domain S-box-containing protein